MADSSSSNPRTAKPALRTAIWLLAFIVLAFAVRTAFSVDSGWDETGQRHLQTGNDPYYHWRTVDHVLRTGETLTHDPAINYPEGAANPNPPFWTWTTAPVASMLSGMGVEDPVGTALNIMVGVWGALIVIPVYMLGRDLWNRRAGLWSAFFIAISAPHIQRSTWGYADHDAISMFSIVLGFSFLVKAILAVQTRNHVTSWRDGKAVSTGVKAAFAANRTPIVWALLAGISISSAALAWKGYPYALGILALATALHLFIDHLRNRDTLGVYLVYLTTVAVVAILPYLLYYVQFPNFFAGTVGPSLNVLLGVLVVGLLLVPTRDLPSVLVFPALLVAAVLGLVLLVLVFPAAGDKVFSGLGYFSQSKLYSTIAEAQRPSLGTVAANFGFFTFLLALWGFFASIGRAVKGHGPSIFLTAWSLVAIFMTFAASRFIMNAAPLFALLTGYAFMRIVGYLGGAEMRKRFRAAHGQGAARRATAALGWKQVLGAIGLVILLALPVMAAVDAGMSNEFESEHKLIDTTRGAPCSTQPDGSEYCTGPFVNPPRFGAFGISFELHDNGWNEAMQALAKLDTCKSSANVCQPGDADYQPLEKRPAFIAWWDYGHWATGIGQHPTVADPFQSHYELAGRFLAADSEAEATSWLVIHLLTGDKIANGGTLSAPVQQAIAGHPALASMPLGYGEYDEAYDVFSANVQGDAIYDLFDRVQAAMGKEIRYFGVDDRMFPYDDPSTNGVERPSIFYAPAYLANKEPDDYIVNQYSGSATLTGDLYGTDADGNSFERDEPLFKDAQGRNFTYYQGYAYPPGASPLQGGAQDSGVAVFSPTSIDIQPRFYDTMFARAYGGLASTEPAGRGLSHWRVIHQSLVGEGEVQLRQVVLLEYTKGVPVSGTLVDDADKPLANQTVAFVDGNGAIHGRSTTDAAGRFTARAPFAIDGDVAFAVVAGETIVFQDNGTQFQFTREQARAGTPVTGVTVKVTRGSVLGHVYVDTNKDNRFDANDTVLEGATVRAAGQSANVTREGTYGIGDLTPGQVTVTASLAGYQEVSRTALVNAGRGTTVDIALTAIPSPVTLRFVGSEDGPAIASTPIKVVGPTNMTVTTNATGAFVAQLAPGSYVAEVNVTSTQDAVPVTQTGRREFVVPVGGAPLAIDIVRDD